MEVKFTIKLQNGEDIRRIEVRDDISLKELQVLIARLFKITEESAQKSTLKYKDDENDLISVTTDEELREAFRFAASQRGVFKLIVQTPPTSASSSTSGPAKTSDSSSNTDSLNDVVGTIKKLIEELAPGVIDVFVDNVNAKPTPPSKEAPVVHNATCDGCSSRIVGLRFKCNQCPDFDFCSVCMEKKGIHPSDHSFTKLERPIPWTHPRCHMRAPGSRCPRRNSECPRRPSRHGECPRSKSETETPKVPTEVPDTPSPSPVADLAPIIPEVPVPVPVEIPVSVPTPVPVPVEVPAPAPAPVEVPTPAPAPVVVEPPSPFAMALKTLEDMGFTEKERNIALLIKYKGDLVPAVRDLLDF